MFCLVPFAIATFFAFYGIVIDPEALTVCLVIFMVFALVGCFIYMMEANERKNSPSRRRRFR